MAYRYLGNKTRISEWIVNSITEILEKGSSIADPMCGTGTMSEAFARSGFTVHASDQLLFPVLHAKARLLYTGSYDFKPIAESYEQAIKFLNSLDPVEDFFWQEYSDEGIPQNGSKSRKYFTGSNAKQIDAIRFQIKQWRRNGLSNDACDLLLHDLILAINDVANIAGTYGYYRSSWNKSSLKKIKLVPSIPVDFTVNHTVQHGKVEDIASKLNVDGCYLDPPYTKRQYGGNYHILETIAQEDKPLPVGEGGLRDWSSESSAYCYKKYAKQAFHDTISGLSTKWVFISYSEDGQVPPDELLDLLSHYGNVERLSKPLTRYNSNNKVSKKGVVKEYLYILDKSNV